MPMSCKPRRSRVLQAGDRIKAMKSLLATHDTDRILLFANVSRDPQVYLLAAHFLQASGSWLRDEGMHKKVVQLYAKAKSPMHTAAFYEACAQAEIDENRDYSKAVAALQARA